MEKPIQKRLEISIVAVGLSIFAAAIYSFDGMKDALAWLPAGDLYGYGAHTLFIEAIVPPVVAVVLGYWLGRRLTVKRDYPLLVSYDGGIMLAVFFVVQILRSMAPLTLETGIVHGLTAFQEISVLLLGLFAGAALVHLRTDDQPPVQPTEATTEVPPAQEAESETTEFDSQPTR